MGKLGKMVWFWLGWGPLWLCASTRAETPTNPFDWSLSKPDVVQTISYAESTHWQQTTSPLTVPVSGIGEVGVSDMPNSWGGSSLDGSTPFAETTAATPAEVEDWVVVEDFQSKPALSYKSQLRSDVWRVATQLDDDFRAMLQPKPMAGLLIAGLVSWGVRDTLDDNVVRYVNEHPNRWGDGTDVLGFLGGPGPHFALTAGLYAWSLKTQDPYLHDFSITLLNTLLISNSLNYGLKIAANGSTPNGEANGWPSGHAESSMACSVVVHRYYGWKAAAPLYLLTGAVSYARIDDSEHYLSDVVFGLALGYIAGHVVTQAHWDRNHGDVFLYSDPYTGARGIGWQKSF